MEPTETKDAGIVPTTTQDRASTPSVDEKKPQAQNGSPQDAEILAALESYVPGTAEEKRLVRKIDFILLPLLWWMYILAYLDRGNIVRPPLWLLAGELPTDELVTNTRTGQRQCCWHE